MAKDGLRVSRKFSNGSVHENASGEFMILERYKKIMR